MEHLKQAIKDLMASGQQKDVKINELRKGTYLNNNSWFFFKLGNKTRLQLIILSFFGTVLPLFKHNC